jgi:hypothetical protein
MKTTILWILAVLLMLSAVIYQRTTGPTYPFRGTLEVDGETFKYRLVRSQETTDNARVVLPDVGRPLKAELHFRRYKTSDTLSVATFTDEGGEWAAYLPIQPAAGKMEYFVTAAIDGRLTRIPTEGEEDIILRYKDPVPGYVLWPHVILMFFSVLFGLRAGLSALFEPSSMRTYAFVALAGITLGGMIIGPIVQKFAFGEYWTGFPFGGDLTDNKTLIMWVVWLIAASVIGAKPKKKEVVSRAVVLVATLVMTVVYLIPHSMRGSELDYSKLDQGVHPSEAIGTGD